MPSMKVPPKRKGNLVSGIVFDLLAPLNESPSEKEGKSGSVTPEQFRARPQ